MTAAFESTAQSSDRWNMFQDIASNSDICMLMTRSLDGRMVSRPMSTQPYAGDEVLWLATDNTSRKATEIRVDPVVNLAYYPEQSGEWLSVSGTARLVHDSARIARAYSPLWKLWLLALDAERDGSARDSRIVLIEVRIEHVHYLKRAHGATSSWTQLRRVFS